MTRDAQLLEGRLALYSGNDEHTFTFLALGASGVISVAANLVPEALVDVVDSFSGGDIARSRTLQLRLNSLIDALFEVSPFPSRKRSPRWACAAGGRGPRWSPWARTTARS